MDIEKLFSGIAIVIDDEVEKPDATISKLIQQIETKHIPFVAYKKLPHYDAVPHLEGGAFLILDWKLLNEEIGDIVQEGVNIPGHLIEALERENIEFIRILKENYFGPIFIFTDEDKEVIINKLIENGLYYKDRPNVILVKNKDELTGEDKLFTEVEDWIKKTPSIYVLKEWEREYRNAKNLLFSDFYQRSPFWPIVLWGSYKIDGANMSRELGEIITRNLYTRMTPFSFDPAIMEVAAASNPEEVRCVLEGERFIKNNQLNAEEIATGDIFQENPGQYLLNIRAQCDLVRGNNPELYCLKGRIVDESRINNGGIPFDVEHGEFREKKNHTIVSCIDDGKIIEFLFRDLKVKKWNNLKDKRIGRLLPPYITRIQQLYSIYFQRQGLPRTPEQVFPEAKLILEEEALPFTY